MVSKKDMLKALTKADLMKVAREKKIKVVKSWTKAKMVAALPFDAMRAAYSSAKPKKTTKRKTTKRKTARKKTTGKKPTTRKTSGKKTTQKKTTSRKKSSSKRKTSSRKKTTRKKR